MPRPPSAKSLLKRNLNKQEIEPKAPIVQEMFLPNYSVVKGSRNLGVEGSVVFLNSGGGLATDNTNFFWDDTNNRLGIGTATPSAELEVNGAIVATTYGGIAEADLLDKSATETVSGTWNFTNVIQAANGTASLPSITFNSDTDTGIYRTATNKLGIAANGALSAEFGKDTTLSSRFLKKDVISLTSGVSPSVSNGNLFVLNYTRSTTITNFTFGVEGQTITILCNDNNTTIADNANIHLNGSTNFAIALGDTLTLEKFDDGIWHEIGRMVR